jgi:DNA polymerase zeta
VDFGCAQTAAAVLQARNSHLETQRQHLLAICLQCGGGGAARGEPGGMARTTCDSLDCSVFFEQRKLDRELAYSTGQATECLRALENRWEDVGDA